MFHFFKNIRRHLANENKFLHYSRYAIGEIVLVMVGILLALQVNNWNESRKQEKVKNEYFLNIKNDLIVDTLKINELILEVKDNDERINQYFSYFDSKTWTLEEVIDSAKNTRSYHHRYFPLMSTYEDMLASGKTNLLDHALKTQLAELKNRQEYLVIIMDRIISDKKQSSYEIEKYWDVESSDRDFFKMVEAEPPREDLIKGLKHRHSLFKRSINAASLITSRTIELKEISTSIINQIDEEMNNYSSE